LDERDFLFPIPEKWLPYFSEGEFSVTYDEGESDYLYLVEDMAGFKGKDTFDIEII